MTLAGIMMTSLSVAMFRKVAWGVDPFTCFVEAMENLTGRSYGIVFPCVQAVLLVITFFLGRHYIGFGMVLSLFGTGLFVEGFARVIELICPAPALAGKLVLFVLGFAVLNIGSALYITSDMGVSSYDAMSLILTDRGMAKFRVCRIFTDCICVATGFVCHANVGVVTVLTAFFMGPVVSWLNGCIAEPILYGKAGRPAQNR
jgi:uncharacterized membrane protein YczE